jgi:hypothetical protein
MTRKIQEILNNNSSIIHGPEIRSLDSLYSSPYLNSSASINRQSHQLTRKSNAIKYLTQKYKLLIQKARKARKAKKTKKPPYNITKEEFETLNKLNQIHTKYKAQKKKFITKKDNKIIELELEPRIRTNPNPIQTDLDFVNNIINQIKHDELTDSDLSDLTISQKLILMLYIYGLTVNIILKNNTSLTNAKIQLNGTIPPKYIIIYNQNLTKKRVEEERVEIDINEIKQINIISTIEDIKKMIK